ncbi:hypothetical protein SAZ10_27225 [Mesorhizobium sp. BAC0120]|uniref:hypothetical protein n=1 Tax=Mesorhizobium sp. BAC0120 TaxID=3090670 RepID=UPI00298C55BF|nr:hypothetical protein [Mesorhizobium sp. BAC0120]MDW6025460.1 hypothetical protein [Mesorhizobium sp. BAC0120]
MRVFICRLLLVLPVALYCGAAARAEGVIFPDLGEKVPGTDVTYLDLAHLVVPDLAAADALYQGHKVIDVRHIAGDQITSAPPETLSFGYAAVLAVQSDGKDRLLILYDLGQATDSAEGFAVLALYSLAGTPKLLDAADIAYDQITNFLEPSHISLGEGKDAVITMSMHFNSNQDYVTSALILLRKDRLQLIDTIFTFSDKSCSFEHQQMPEFRAGDRDGRAYSDIVVTVTETTKPTGEICDGEDALQEANRQIAVTYRWDEAASRFIVDSDALKVLAKEDESRF